MKMRPRYLITFGENSEYASDRKDDFYRMVLSVLLYCLRISSLRVNGKLLTGEQFNQKLMPCVERYYRSEKMKK